jgi:hypothetical protein
MFLFVLEIDDFRGTDSLTQLGGFYFHFNFGIFFRFVREDGYVFH